MRVFYESRKKVPANLVCPQMERTSLTMKLCMFLTAYSKRKVKRGENASVRTRLTLLIKSNWMCFKDNCRSHLTNYKRFAFYTGNGNERIRPRPPSVVVAVCHATETQRSSRRLDLCAAFIGIYCVKTCLFAKCCWVFIHFLLFFGRHQKKRRTPERDQEGKFSNETDHSRLTGQTFVFGCAEIRLNHKKISLF